MKIKVREATEADVREVESWPEWSCEPSTFEWHYDEVETCYIIKGRATVKADNQEVSFGPGDWVVFPKGLSCVWVVHESIRKKYSFS
ncbi:DUF861 domain-containing protein [archaeon]|nr:DUF861 domain-containing protein [archaeon]